MALSKSRPLDLRRWIRDDMPGSQLFVQRLVGATLGTTNPGVIRDGMACANSRQVWYGCSSDAACLGLRSCAWSLCPGRSGLHGLAEELRRQDVEADRALGPSET